MENKPDPQQASLGDALASGKMILDVLGDPEFQKAADQLLAAGGVAVAVLPPILEALAALIRAVQKHQVQA